MNTTLVEPTRCKTCYHKIDAVTSAGHKSKPQKNDLSICLNCGTISSFDEHLDLVPLSDDDIDKLYAHNYQNWLTLQRASSYIKKKIKEN